MDAAAQLAALRAQIDAVQSPMDDTLGKLLGHVVACHREIELRRAYEQRLEAELAAARELLAQRESGSAIESEPDVMRAVSLAH